jgi:transcriptional regulator GlxA family with amidase domain
VAAISGSCGFANAFHFSREFSRRYGMPPRRYRDEQRLASGA